MFSIYLNNFGSLTISVKYWIVDFSRHVFFLVIISVSCRLKSTFQCNFTGFVQEPQFLKYGLFLLLASVNLMAQNNLEISILTCESGEELYATFGHTAIRVIDYAKQKDLVYDYGNFDFETPFFMLKFLRGSLDYHLDVMSFSTFQKGYQRANRGVIEQKLNLDPATKQKIHQQLLLNLQSENRYYKYDFLKDNCVTRIRDIINQYATIQVPTSPEKTHRAYLKEYLVSKKWLAFGIDILLGSKVDKCLTTNEAIFLPSGLSESLKNYRVIETNKPLIGKQRVVVKSKKTTASSWSIFQPFYCFILLFMIVLFLSKNRAVATKVANFFYLSFGLGGLLLLFLWFGTRHDATQMNYNLLWLNPFYLILPFLKNSIFKKRFLKAIFLITSLVLLFWVAIPQVFHLAFIPLIAIILLVSFAAIKNTSSN